MYLVLYSDYKDDNGDYEIKGVYEEVDKIIEDLDNLSSSGEIITIEMSESIEIDYETLKRDYRGKVEIPRIRRPIIDKHPNQKKIERKHLVLFIHGTQVLKGMLYLNERFAREAILDDIRVMSKVQRRKNLKYYKYRYCGIITDEARQGMADDVLKVYPSLRKR